MALIKTITGDTPKIGKNCFLAENSTIIGNVEIGNFCSIWFNTVIRGDVNPIKIGKKVNIQDNVVLHCKSNDSIIIIGDYVTIGHNAIIHGAEINNNVLIGMGSIILDNAKIQQNSIIAAGSLVPCNTIVESGCIYGGNPVKKIKTINQEKIKILTQKTAENYIKYANWYR